MDSSETSRKSRISFVVECRRDWTRKLCQACDFELAIKRTLSLCPNFFFARAPSVCQQHSLSTNNVRGLLTNMV